MTSIHHDLSPRDRAAMVALRERIERQPRPDLEPEGRPRFDELIAKTPVAEGVVHAPAVVGGIAGWWCRPAEPRRNVAILYLHGGAYVIGSAAAYRAFVGQIAARTGMAAFVAEYALAPERPFPAAFDDARAAYRGLVNAGHARIVLIGDSAGGGLALALLAALSGPAEALPRPLSAIVLSPWIDLALGGDSMETRARVDPVLTREALSKAAARYLAGHDPRDPRASALSAATAGLPPVQVHVGEDEILLDDAVRYARTIDQAGGTVELHVWQGMTHIFPVNVALLAAAQEALDLIGAFARRMNDKGRC